MKRPAFKNAVAWIAQNDEPGEQDLDVTAEQISVLLTADLFEVTPEKVAAAVIAYRSREEAP